MENAPMKLKEAHGLIEQFMPQIRKMLPEHVTPERMLRVMQNAVSKNPKLLQCTSSSLMGAVVVASELGLEPNTPLGHCYLIPYNNWNAAKRTKVMEATLQIGYQGLMELCYRSGKVKGIRAEVVRENDTFAITRGLHPDIQHIDAKGDRGAPVGYYAVLTIEGIEPMFQYMSEEEVRQHAEKFSPSYFKYGTKEIDPKGLYGNHPEAYGLKTVIKKVCKYGPKSVEDKLYRALEVDDARGRTIVTSEGDIALNFDVPESPIEIETATINLDDVTPTAEQPTDAGHGGEDAPKPETLNDMKVKIMAHVESSGMHADEFDNFTEAAGIAGAWDAKGVKVEQLRKLYDLMTADAS